MGRKQGRRLPTWYLDAVNMASEVFADAPQAVDMRRPHIDPRPNAGTGVQSQRIGRRSWTQPSSGGGETPVQLDVEFPENRP